MKIAHSRAQTQTPSFATIAEFSVEKSRKSGENWSIFPAFSPHFLLKNQGLRGSYRGDRLKNHHLSLESLHFSIENQENHSLFHMKIPETAPDGQDSVEFQALCI